MGSRGPNALSFKSLCINDRKPFEPQSISSFYKDEYWSKKHPIKSISIELDDHDKELEFDKNYKLCGHCKEIRARNLFGTDNKRKDKNNCWCNLCRTKFAKLDGRKLKHEVINNYGGTCKKCGETRIEFLSIEHTKRNGKEHRKKTSRIYRDLKDRRFPKNLGLEVLCYNCNFSDYIVNR